MSERSEVWERDTVSAGAVLPDPTSHPLGARRRADLRRGRLLPRGNGRGPSRPRCLGTGVARRCTARLRRPLGGACRGADRRLDGPSGPEGGPRGWPPRRRRRSRAGRSRRGNRELRAAVPRDGGVRAREHVEPPRTLCRYGPRPLAATRAGDQHRAPGDRGGRDRGTEPSCAHRTARGRPGRGSRARDRSSSRWARTSWPRACCWFSSGRTRYWPHTPRAGNRPHRHRAGRAP